MGRRVHDSKRQLIIYLSFLSWSWRVGIVFMSLSPSSEKVKVRLMNVLSTRIFPLP